MSGTYVSLFAGIGGIDLGLDRAGFRCVGQVELDPFCRSILDARWPSVPKHDDVRTFPAWWAEQSRPVVDVVAGGFPCQPFSDAGRRAGTADKRWGWSWMFNAVTHVQPRAVIAENTPGLMRDGDAFGRVVGDLHAAGLSPHWSVLSACAVGAPHMRKRLFIIGGTLPATKRGALRRSYWATHAEPRRVVPDAVRRGDRNRALGNAVVPAVAEQVGRARDVSHAHSAACSFWPTPRADGSNSAGGTNSRLSALRNGTYVTGQRNPLHTEWLMGFPPGWTELP